MKAVRLGPCPNCWPWLVARPNSMLSAWKPVARLTFRIASPAAQARSNLALKTGTSLRDMLRRCHRNCGGMTGRGWSVATWRDWSGNTPRLGRSLPHDGPNDGLILHLSTDTRTLFHPGASVFFAIRGPWHDGHTRGDAHSKGCDVVVSDCPEAPSCEDSDVGARRPAALQHMAHAKRMAFQGPVLAVTGSNGKTTVKEWLARLLPPHRALHRPQSHNSQLGCL